VPSVGDSAPRAVGAFLRSLRESQRLSQQRLSEMTESEPWKISRPVISAVERGEHLPSFEALMVLSKALHFDPMELLERAELAVAVPIDVTDLTLEDLRSQGRDFALAGDYRSALAAYDAMLERATLDPPPAEEISRLKAEIELRRAGALSRCGALLSAEASAKRAVSLSEDSPDYQSFAYAVLAKVQIKRGFLPLARDHAQRAVERAEGCDAAIAGRAQLQLGEVLFDSDDFEGATEVFLKARELLREGQDLDHLSHVEGNVGLCWGARGDSAKARVWFRRGLELARKHGLPIIEARWLTELGHLGLQAGRLDEADRYARAALAIARPRDHWLTLFRAEWLRHQVVGKKDAKATDKPRLALLKKLMVHLADHKNEREIREYLQTVGETSIRRPE
jgi:tetratricopeptide (TPR) repeat protein